MDSVELEQLLIGTAESPTLDFKGACDCDIKVLAKDILAMANTQGGGHIVIGVEDRTFKRTGMTEQQQYSYEVDGMKDVMANYADPYVNFDVYRVNDSDDLRYVVIRVHEFDEVPVICKKDSSDTKQGTVYYRTRNRRVESAHVSNSYDMREIIDRSTAKMMTKRKASGYNVIFSPSETDLQTTITQLNQELGGL